MELPSNNIGGNMHWYSLMPTSLIYWSRDYYQALDSNIATGKMIPYEFNYQGVIYTPENIPSGTINRKVDSSSDLMNLSFPYLTAVYKAYRNQSLPNKYFRGRPRIVRSIEALTIKTQSLIEELEITTISGKYRMRSGIEKDVDKRLSAGTIPVKMSVNNELYNYFVFSGSNKHQYLYNSAFFSNLYAFGAYKTAMSSGSITEEYDDEGWIVFTKDNSREIKDEFSGMLIDFGDIPQEVPSLFLEWIENNFDKVYPYTYQIKSSDGEILASIIEAPPIKSALLGSLSDSHILTLTGTNNVNYTVQWNNKTPQDYIYKGLGLSPRGSVIIPVGSETNVEWDSDITLYDIFLKYNPPSTTFDLNLYQSTAETNRVDKFPYLFTVATLSGVLRERCSLVSPVLTIEYPKVPDFNYVYIEAFGRYYFVTGVVSVRYNLWEISLECDVLMTYKDKLLECEAFIDRNENTFNPLIVDRRKVIEQGQNIIALAAENEVFGDVGSYIMVASNTGVTSVTAKVIFDGGVTVRIGETEISSGDTISAYPVIVTCNKETCYINGRIIAQASVIEIDAQQSIYITTAGADREVAFTVTINDTPD